MNVEAIAFLTSRVPTSRGGEERAKQLVVGFSAASSVSSGALLPLSLVLESDEAEDFLKQLKKRGVVVDHLKKKLA